MKDSIQQEDITIISIYNYSTSKPEKQTLRELMRQRDNSTVIAGDFPTLPILERASRQRLWKEIE